VNPSQQRLWLLGSSNTWRAAVAAGSRDHATLQQLHAWKITSAAIFTEKTIEAMLIGLLHSHV
jgi:hypothetical protein